MEFKEECFFFYDFKELYREASLHRNINAGYNNLLRIMLDINFKLASTILFFLVNQNSILNI